MSDGQPVDEMVVLSVYVEVAESVRMKGFVLDIWSDLLKVELSEMLSVVLMGTLRGKRLVGGTDNELAGWKEVSKGLCTVANWE